MPTVREASLKGQHTVYEAIKVLLAQVIFLGPKKSQFLLLM